MITRTNQLRAALYQELRTEAAERGLLTGDEYRVAHRTRRAAGALVFSREAPAPDALWGITRCCDGFGSRSLTPGGIGWAGDQAARWVAAGGAPVDLHLEAGGLQLWLEVDGPQGLGNVSGEEL